MHKLIIASTVSLLAIAAFSAPPGGQRPNRNGGGNKGAPQANVGGEKRQPNRGGGEVRQPNRGGGAVRQPNHGGASRNDIGRSHHRMDMRGAGGVGAPPHRHGFHANRPDGARFWGRPALPPPMTGAMYAWRWIDTAWNYTVDGVYYYGEGYYFDGYNYCYNGGYHLTPPPVVVATPAVVTPTVVTQPAVVTPVVTPTTVVTPVVTQPATPPPPPPPKRGLLNVLFGD